MSTEFAEVRREKGKIAEILCSNCREWQPWSSLIQAVRIVQVPLAPQPSAVKQEGFLRCPVCGAEVKVQFRDDGAIWWPKSKRTRTRKGE